MTGACVGNTAAGSFNKEARQPAGVPRKRRRTRVVGDGEGGSCGAVQQQEWGVGWYRTGATAPKGCWVNQPSNIPSSPPHRSTAPADIQ